MDALTLIRQEGGFDLVVLDYDMPDVSGLGGLKRMCRLNKGRPVALMSGVAPSDIASLALSTGAAGFIPKTLSSHSLVAAVRLMIAGEIFVPFSYMTDGGRSMGEALVSLAVPLTLRERNVLQSIGLGRSNQEIGAKLGLSEATVRTIFRRLNVKFGTRNRLRVGTIAVERKHL